MSIIVKTFAQMWDVERNAPIGPLTETTVNQNPLTVSAGPLPIKTPPTSKVRGSYAQKVTDPTPVITPVRRGRGISIHIPEIELLELHSKGFSTAALCERFGCAKATLFRRLKQLKNKKRPTSNTGIVTLRRKDKTRRPIELDEFLINKNSPVYIAISWDTLLACIKLNESIKSMAKTFKCSVSTLFKRCQAAKTAQLPGSAELILNVSKQTIMYYTVEATANGVRSDINTALGSAERPKEIATVPQSALNNG